MRVALFPDTNVVLHFKPFAEIDWRTLAKADEVTLVASAILVREVDNKKNSARGHIQKRARQFASWLGTLPDTAAATVRDNVTIEIRVEEPELALDFAARGLVPTIADDRLVAAMIVYAEGNPQTQCACVTDDALLVRKVRAAGFTIIAPPEGARLKDEPDARDVEIRELHDANVELKRQLDARPSFELSFGARETKHLRLRFGRLRVPDAEEVEVLLASERSMLETIDRFAGGMWEPPPQHKIVDYIAEVRAWLPSHVEHERQRMLTTRIDEMTLHNVGGGNGKDIEITLTFPDHVYVAAKREIERQPKPKAPEPRNRFAMPFETLAHPPSDYFARLVGDAFNPKANTLTEVGPHELDLYVRDLKHNDNRRLDSFDLWFESPDDIGGGATVGFKIHAATPPVVTGELHLAFELNDWGLSLAESRKYRQR